MATIKQLKIGNTNYDIKALNATNNDQANAVVRDIQYGTAAPSGGSAGQVYLQYNSSTADNPYVYAEDTIGSQNAVDNYYSKSETDQMINEVSNSIANIKNFSTEKTVIGYWIDGRPVYRQVFTGNGNNVANTEQKFTLGSGQIAWLLRVYGSCLCQGDGYLRPAGSTSKGDANDVFDAYYRYSDNKLVVTTGSNLRLNKFYIIAEYIEGAKNS